MACSSMARCAGAHACWRSLRARVRASINVARSLRFRISSSESGVSCCRSWTARPLEAAASCCASTALLSQPRAIFVGSPLCADRMCRAPACETPRRPGFRHVIAATTYLAWAAARSAAGTAIRSGFDDTCDLTISSACATAPASPARYTELASMSDFCEVGVESWLS
jgi:hypothetical protein